MSDTAYLDWPFFEVSHRGLAIQLDAWAAENLCDAHDSDVDAACRRLVARLGTGGWLRHAVAGVEYPVRRARSRPVPSA